MEEKKQKAGKRPLAGSGGGLPYDWCTTNCPTNNIFTHPVQSYDVQPTPTTNANMNTNIGCGV